MRDISRTLNFNKDRIFPPEFYLGDRIEKQYLNENNMCTMARRD